jgi:hypothetical protein
MPIKGSGYIGLPLALVFEKNIELFYKEIVKKF